MADDRYPWGKLFAILGGTLGYMIPLFWMWHDDNYPDGFGVHITAHGKAGLFESWWYSYLLAERHQALDVVLFIYMWLPLVAVILWLSRPVWQRPWRIFDDE